MHDPQIWSDARQRLPLPDLLSKLGDGEFREKKAPCPFCGAKGGKWGLFKKGDRDFFKCHAPDCVANEPDGGNSEIGYLVLRRGLSAKEAATEYLRMAVPERVPQLFETPAPKTSGGSSRVEPPPVRPRRPSDAEPKNVWHALWQRYPLTAEDHASLMSKRGFSPETIEVHGIRSNNMAYRSIVEGLAEDYPISVLLAEGIFKEEGRTRPSPTGQFYGYGITGEKDEHGQPIFAQTEPPIIPYFDAEGIPYYLRPHKGGVRKPRTELEDIQTFEDEDDASTCAAEVFIPIGTDELVELADGRCILTEGEFKAIAGAQCQVPIIACPGISFIRNPAFRRKLEAALDRLGVTELIIIFDNEVKNDPQFPDRYKPDPWNQWDTQVYAEYTMRELRGYFGRVNGIVRVGSLPDELRIEGKADFDGILAKCVADSGLVAGTKAARKIFRRAMDAASNAPANELWPSEARRIIECKVERMFHRPRVPIGGKRELQMARRFGAYDPETGDVVDKKLAEAMEEVIGCYSLRKKPDKDERKALNLLKDSLAGRIRELEELLKTAREPNRPHAKIVSINGGNESSETPSELRSKLKLLYGRVEATWERIKGVPERISTFTLSCEYKLHTADGLVDRLVRVTRRRSGRYITEKIPRRLTPTDLQSGRDFRRWGYGVGDAVFGGSGGGGEKDVQDLVEDMDHHSYLRDIHELDTYGWHEESGIWFFGDCAFPPNGSVIHADKSGIFWYEGMGYQFTALLESEGQGEAFCQGAPLLLSSQDRAAKATNGAWIKAIRTALAENVKDHREALDLADKMLNQTAPPDCHALIAAAPAASQAALRTALCGGILSQAMEDLFNTIGDYDGWTIIGLMMAYSIGPELCRQGGHPGIWFTGKMSSGKTTIGRWAMRFWGFRELGGIKLGAKSTTTVGFNRVLTQYSSLPLLTDEYRQDTIEMEKEETLRGAFDRSGGAKGIADHSKKTRNPVAKTTPVVMGESSSKDGATRSRYAQIHVSIHQRIGDGAGRYPRVQNECKHWHMIGRWLMENREVFKKAAMEKLLELNESPTVRQHIHNDRVRLVYGVAFSCFVTVAEQLGVLNWEKLNAFQQFLLRHGEKGLADVVEETFLARFWSDVITACQRNEISKGLFEERYVTIQADGALEKANANAAGAIRVCYIGFKPVFACYLMYKRKLGETAPLGEGDVRRELEKERYWLPYPARKNEGVHRLRLNGTKTACWVINLERHSSGPEDPRAEEERPFICPFAEDLLNVLEAKRSEDGTPET
ncbi:MAG TPA: hypothetical protein VF614_13460 [Chthoniobacteraceae bacterium]|jgi:hypothetical protein